MIGFAGTKEVYRQKKGRKIQTFRYYPSITGLKEIHKNTKVITVVILKIKQIKTI